PQSAGISGRAAAGGGGSACSREPLGASSRRGGVPEAGSHSPAGLRGASSFSAPPPGRACSGGASSRRGGSGLPPSAPAPRGRPSVRRSRPAGRGDRDSGRADGVTLSDADDAPVGACGARLRSPGGCEGTPEPPVGDVPAGGAGGTEGRG